MLSLLIARCGARAALRARQDVTILTTGQESSIAPELESLSIILEPMSYSHTKDDVNNSLNFLRGKRAAKFSKALANFPTGMEACRVAGRAWLAIRRECDSSFRIGRRGRDAQAVAARRPSSWPSDFGIPNAPYWSARSAVCLCFENALSQTRCVREPWEVTRSSPCVWVRSCVRARLSPGSSLSENM